MQDTPKHNKKKRIPLWIKILLPLLLLVLVLPLAAAASLYESYFDHRWEETQEEVPLSLKDFPSLSATKVIFPSGSNTLTGYLYYKDNDPNIKGMVIVCHELWSTHTSLLTQINDFVENNFLVFAYDSTGTGQSQGSSPTGLVQSQLDLDAALTYLENQPSFQMTPKLLYGYGCGAYAATNVLPDHPNIQAVAAMAPFHQSGALLADAGRSKYGSWFSILSPYMQLYERIKFGSAAKKTTLDGISETGIPVLICHSQEDTVIPFSVSPCAFQEQMDDSQVRFLLVSGKGHTPFLSDKAIQYRASYAALSQQEKKESVPDKTLFYELDDQIQSQVLTLFCEAVQ